MQVSTEKYVRKPLYVEAVRITTENFNDIAKWCQGEVLRDDSGPIDKKYIKVRVHNPRDQRQTKAYVGDWILYTDRGYKIYTHKSFTAAFDPAEDAQIYPRMDGGFVVIGPQCFAEHDGSVLNWRGENYVPQSEDRSVEAQVQDEMERTA